MLYREQSYKLFDILKTELEENKAEKVFEKISPLLLDMYIERINILRGWMLDNEVVREKKIKAKSNFDVEEFASRGVLLGFTYCEELLEGEIRQSKELLIQHLKNGAEEIKQKKDN